jgi:pimeloyl-ACP methyl ester carboxylesterase
VLLIGGERDKAVPADALKSQAGLNPRTTLLILPDTGHMGMFEKFEETVQAVESFLWKIYQPLRP